MTHNLKKQTEKIKKQHMWRSRWYKLLGILGCVIVFCTTYALILPAITLEETVYCGIEEHTHSLACYSNPEADVETAADWEAAFSDVKLTGIWSDDLLAIADTQLGYTESEDNYQVADDGVTKKGYTRYGEWYGNPYGDWCAMFVSFCLNYAKIPEEVFTREGDVGSWIGILSGNAGDSNYGLYTKADDYIPAAGDLVFFDTDEDGEADHMGIVSEYLEDSQSNTAQIKTIEGDSGDKVQSTVYGSDDGTILGYAALPENPALPGNPAMLTDNDEMMPLTLNADELSSQSFALVNGSKSVAMLAESHPDSSVKKMLGKVVSVTGSGDSRYVKVDSEEDVANVKRWNFTPTADNNDTYYLTTTVGDSLKYLKIGEKTEGITLVDDIADASVIIITEGTGNHAGMVRVKRAESNIAINLYGGNASGGFGPWDDEGVNEWFYLISDVRTSYGTVEGVTPMGTVINLFDYWMETVDENDTSNNNDRLTVGINAGHIFKFIAHPDGKDVFNSGTANRWTGSSAVLQGLVANKLGKDGFPYLSGDSSLLTNASIDNNTYDLKESLGYLFNPDVENNYRNTYEKVGNLLQIDENGYYYYNSKVNYAEYDKQKNEFILYDNWAVQFKGEDVNQGEFFPFNARNTVSQSTSANSPDLNHFFGMTLTTRFVQEHQGYTDASRKVATTFEFSGDDDVWIFIDGVLVADLGGIHDAAKVRIDFSTGEVSINNGTKTTTLKQAFESAGVDWENGDSDTFADDTYHTLKFYYLERGSMASNLHLKYNLKAIPSSSIVKVDQYGKAVPEAEFALYAAKKYAADKDKPETYRYLLDGSDNIYVTLDDAPYTIGEVDGKKGVITIQGGEYAGRTITPIYYGTTDEEGKMTFVDEDEIPLALADLKKKANNSPYFILQELVIPDGYRAVADEIWLYLQNSVLYCDNVYSSGAWASATALITATDKLYLNDSALNAQTPGTIPGIRYDTEKQQYVVDYYSLNSTTSKVETNGTLFAVVLKYIGGTSAEELGKTENWVPVYGNDLQGYNRYEVADEAGIITRDSFITAVARMAEMMDTNSGYSDTVFELASSGAMQVLLTNLPGELKTYYSMLLKTYNPSSGKALEQYIAENIKYTVAYYWTSEDSLENATALNTFRVNAEAVENATAGFERTFGATIGVPNLVNRLLVQKKDESGNLVDGATFALYKADQAGNYYIVDEEGNIVEGSDPVSLEGAVYEINEATGVITVRNSDGSETVIYPVETATTNSGSIAGEPGTTVFGDEKLERGYYYVREISAPAGYIINDTEIRAVVTDYGIYADAGTADDGVTVALTPGYVVSTLQKFASYGDIDNTLTWIYTMLRVNQNAGFNDFRLDKHTDISGWPYVADRNGTEAVNFVDTMRAYLVYNPTSSEALFNYQLQEDALENNRRLYTDVGWPYLEIFQNYAHGSEHKKPGANYTNLKGQDISNLFSRAVYIQVTDKRVPDIAIKKVDANNTEKVLSGAKFRLYYTETSTTGEGEEAVTTVTRHYYRNTEGTVFWTENEEEADVVTTDKEGLATFTELLDGTYYLEEISAPEGYHLLAEPVPLKIERAVVSVLNVSGSNSGAFADAGKVDEATNKYVYTVTIPNSSGYVLPDTGGAGTQMYTWAGMLLLFGSMMTLLYKYKKRQRKECKE